MIRKKIALTWPFLSRQGRLVSAGLPHSLPHSQGDPPARQSPKLVPIEVFRRPAALARHAQAARDMKTILIASVFAFGAFAFFGCNTVDNAVDCKGICERYKDCFDEKY